MKGWLGKLIAGLLVAALILGGVEGGLRLALGPPPPPVRVYRALDEHQHYFQVQDGQVRATYVRGTEIPPFPVSSPTQRVAVLGGSSVHGGSPGVPAEWEFPARIGAVTGLEVLNLGQPGLDSFDLTRMVEELLEAGVRLDALILYTGHNDFGNTFFEERYGTLSAGLSARALSVLGRLQMFSQLSQVLQPVSGMARRSGTPAHDDDKGVPLTDARKALALQSLGANLNRIAWRTARAGMPLVLVTPVSRLARQPGKKDCPPGEDEDCPRILFAQAHAVRETDPVQARTLLRQARDRDRESICAPTAAQERVLQIAEAWPHAIGVDAERLLPRDAHFDVPASALFIDTIHLTRRGHVALAEVTAPAVAAAVARGTAARAEAGTP